MNDPSQSTAYGDFSPSRRTQPTYDELKQENERLQAQVDQLLEEIAFLKKQIPANRELQFVSVDADDDKNPKKAPGDVPEILLCGLPGCGKTSIRKVVFESGSPDFQARNAPTTEPFFLRVDRGELVFDLVELPFTHAQQDSILAHAQKARSMLFILDAQEIYEDPLAWACRLIKRLNSINRSITFHILLHKMDGDNLEAPESRREMLRSVHEFLEETLETDADVSVHCTSIYHHSLFEAFSSVIQAMMPHLLSLELLLNSLVEKNKMEKALLMDGQTKLVICQDSSVEQVGEPLFKMACDMMELTQGFTSIDDISSVGTISIAFESDTVVRLRYLNPTLALVYMTKSCQSPGKLVEHNVDIFNSALLRLLKDMK